MKSKIIKEICAALILKDREPYNQLRGRVILSHGYNYFRDVQSEAFEELFSPRAQRKREIREKLNSL